MKIATLNINSINARLSLLSDWISANKPDVLLLQEIKTEFNNFPFFDLQMLGYDVKILGQKGYNGVAVLSKSKITVRHENLPEFPDENSRYLEIETYIDNEKYVISSIYLPNGNPPYNNPTDTSKFEYKLKWMDAFLSHVEDLFISYKNVILGGDFNVILTSKDVYNPELFEGNALYRKEVWDRMKKLLNIGYTDSYRAFHKKESGYTFWDYTGGAFQNDLGMRIDYLFTSPALSDRLSKCYIDKDFRAKEKSSDHTVLVAEIGNNNE